MKESLDDLFYAELCKNLNEGNHNCVNDEVRIKIMQLSDEQRKELSSRFAGDVQALEALGDNVDWEAVKASPKLTDDVREKFADKLK